MDNTSTLTDKDGFITVIYYETPIFRYNPSKREVILSTGGYYTASTKKRINECFQMYNIPFELKSIESKWFILTPKERIRLADGEKLKF